MSTREKDILQAQFFCIFLLSVSIDLFVNRPSRVEKGENGSLKFGQNQSIEEANINEFLTIRCT